jgi:queuine tRNA-ribosyltransferase
VIGFTLLGTDGAARRGQVATAHGTIETPAFMPVGNTYHLMLRPGAERIAALGGLHRFMNWPKSILTDSGGYQVMSLAKLRKIDEAGVTFQSHLDGMAMALTPERSIEIQHLLGADITMAFDECTPFPATEPEARQSMELSMRWAARSKAAFRPRDGMGLFGIVQGSVYPALRLRSAQALTQIGFDGYAVGGLAVGEGQETMFAVLDETVPALPTERPRYLMGVGKPADIVGAVMRGIDMFDCVMPTRSGRTAQAFTRRGTLALRNARHVEDPRPLDEACGCAACRQYSRAYLHHLIKADEILGCMLLTEHNLRYYGDLMRDLRDAIVARKLTAFAAGFAEMQAQGDIPPL